MSPIAFNFAVFDSRRTAFRDRVLATVDTVRLLSRPQRPG
jgi:hypothetical protein